MQEEEAEKSSWGVPIWKNWCRKIVKSKPFNIVTAILTIFALTGDDCRILFTERPADALWDKFTATCIAVFSIEIIMSCVGREDYFLGFFFLLDVASTATLFLDLSSIQELFRQDDENMESMRSSRTAKVGARAGRMVRVLRLVRILKLYKAVYDHAMRQVYGNTTRDEEDWAETEDNYSARDSHTQSRVGKKLSEITTRKVIILVLVMLVTLPLMSVDTNQQFPTSADYGVGEVFMAFQNLAENGGSMTEAEFAEARFTYETTFLRLVYFHNWFLGADDSCPRNSDLCSNVFYARLFWIGIASTDLKQVENLTSLARISSTTVEQWAAMTSEQNDIWNYGSMPDGAGQVLGGPWVESCTSHLGKRRLGLALIGKDWDGSVQHPARCPEALRRAERFPVYPRGRTTADHQKWTMVFYFDNRPFEKTAAYFALMIMVFICLALLSASMMFAHNANTLVLHPLEKMIAKIEVIRENPMAAMKLADQEFKNEERRKERDKAAKKDMFSIIMDYVLCRGEGAQEPLETVILEKTIVKLGSLLALGFGQAGAYIIEHNMSGVGTAWVDAMIEGDQVDCVVGVARIADFSTATEVLQGKVMAFVNQIAEIVHGVANEFHGAANRNNGSSFLIIWRFSSLEPQYVERLADLAMMAFARMLGAVHRSRVIAEYRGHPGLQQRLGRHCRMNLSFGLHFGWAIEGAVGSEFKIDASYLSPNVSVAESIEHATQVYSVSILLSEQVRNICSAAMASQCRLIDKVVLTGSSQAIELYVFDLDHLSLTVEKPRPVASPPWTSRQRFKARQKLEAEKNAKWHAGTDIVEEFFANRDISTMRERYTQEFLSIFNMGYQNYSQGEWQVAQRLLSRTRIMLGMDDGPSTALLRFMGTPYDYVAPTDWKGKHELFT